MTGIKRKAASVTCVMVVGMVLLAGGCGREEGELEPMIPAVIPEEAEPVELSAEEKQGEGRLKAVFKTEKGDITCILFAEEAPLTVENFISLARGTREWVDPESGDKVRRPLYDGTIFHRVIPGFMIQGGDPEGTGRGGPGYRFADEISETLSFDRAGLLAMANAGPNTNGSQFFITLEPTPWLDGRHTIFGEVVSGQEVVAAIAGVARDRQDRPLEPVRLDRVVIVE